MASRLNRAAEIGWAFGISSGYGECVGVVEDTLGTHPWIPALVSQCTEEGYIEK